MTLDLVIQGMTSQPMLHQPLSRDNKPRRDQFPELVTPINVSRHKFNNLIFYGEYRRKIIFIQTWRETSSRGSFTFVNADAPSGEVT